MARINEHHSLYGSVINSDTVLWLSWYASLSPGSIQGLSADSMLFSRMWMIGPVQWINLIGWRKLLDFEVHAMFVYWREMSVMLGCKWVPNTLQELEAFRLVRNQSLTIRQIIANLIFTGLRGQGAEIQPLERHVF